MREWRPLADGGDSIAQYTLGVMYSKGQGVSTNDVEAVKWFRLAAEQNDADAQNSLALMYSQGKGVPEDDVQAYAWWSLAAAQGHAGAALGKRIIQPLLPPEQLAAADKLSDKLCAKIANCAKQLTAKKATMSKGSR
jgi:TPR repeat protein